MAEIYMLVPNLMIVQRSSGNDPTGDVVVYDYCHDAPAGSGGSGIGGVEVTMSIEVSNSKNDRVSAQTVTAISRDGDGYFEYNLGPVKGPGNSQVYYRKLIDATKPGYTLAPDQGQQLDTPIGATFSK